MAADGNLTGIGDVTLGNGANTLVLRVSQDAYQGDAQYTVAVDGQQVGGVITAQALHGQGSDTVTLHGDWGSGGHTVAVTFLNDLYGGTPETDRNLHVDGISLDGAGFGGVPADLLGGGTASFGTDGAAFSGQAMPVEAPAAASGWREVWHEDFASGSGALSRVWGPGVDTSVPGQLTIHSTADNQDSGAMVPPTGADTGFGYGRFDFTMDMQGSIGVYALTWPATDRWPGPELDLVEIDSSGRAYSTIHWRGDDGSNQFASFGLGDIDLTQTHTYSLEWTAGRLTGLVDGQEKWTTTEHVPADAAHGGENTAPGVGVQTWWNGGALGGDNSITLHHFAYSVIA